MDRYKLEYEMKKRNVTVEDLCEACGLSKSSFYRKCSSKCSNEFTVGEINKIVNFLQLDSPMGIFFADKVS